MARCAAVLCVCFLLAAPILAQTASSSDPQALALVAQSMAALTGGNTIHDVTLIGSVTWNQSETGTATLRALGTEESRIELDTSTDTRVEIRDSQTGTRQGKWQIGDKSEAFSPHNCWTDAVWFFPALSALADEAKNVFVYVGKEDKLGVAVQHIRSYQNQLPSNIQPLSAMDFYLDAATLLPLAVVFNVHPGNDSNANFISEIDFSDYQMMDGLIVPSHIRKYQAGTLWVDFVVSSATYNSGLPLSTFAVN